MIRFILFFLKRQQKPNHFFDDEFIDSKLSAIFSRDDLPAELKDYLSDYSDEDSSKILFENELESPMIIRNKYEYLNEIKSSPRKQMIVLKSFLLLPVYHIEAYVNILDHAYRLIEVNL